MSDETDITTQPDGERALVAEYVLGLLDSGQHEAVRAQIEADPRLQREERLWQWHFSALDDQFGDVPAPERLQRLTEERLFGRAEARGGLAGLWHNLALWRGLAAGALAVAVLAVGLATMMPQPSSTQLATELVAALQAEGSDVQFVALYDSESGNVRLVGLSGVAGPQQDFELWAIQGENPPISMGVIEAMTRNEVRVGPDVAPEWGPGSVLAITLEPEGGSPTGDPTGPVVAQGAATPI
ncbi:anti-sigma K factor RskA [Devosia pacifica]|uniref:Anti-sigma K factor RskA n=1 Tax=Devosia pacifica TaxID=1335967 RepID=A0A918VV88_9HYPH|nr:anti-sigma factor [Devosia pacifica]GHA32474.1 anti-sigma K factor RskA [Devosia pacifica]